MNRAPKGIIESIASYIRQDPVRMHMPGHKGHTGHEGQKGHEGHKGHETGVAHSCLEEGAVSQVSDMLCHALDSAKILDVTEVHGLDNLNYPNGAIETMQSSMAEAFGTATTYCLVNGATCGILASLIALRMTLGPGTVIVPRNAHRSIISGLVLSGLDPFFVYPEYDGGLGGYLPLTASDIETQLKEACISGRLKPRQPGDLAEYIKGIVLVNPTYSGAYRNIAPICRLADEAGVPVIADEAHGTLFYFSKNLPASAIETGASLVIHGAHKTTQAFTQTGLLHVPVKCLDTFPALARNVEEALRLVQSTSPSYILLASLERAIESLKQDSTWVETMIQSARLIQCKLSSVRGIRVKIPGEDTGLQWDPGKILIDVSGLGISGPQAQALLWEKGKVVPEMVGPDYVLLMVTGADTSSSLEAVARVFQGISDEYVGLHNAKECLPVDSYPEISVCQGGPCSKPLRQEPPRAEAVMPLSQAFYSRGRDFSLKEAVGKISCDTVLIYPPGSPVIVPGERIGEEVVEYLSAAVDCGLEVLGRGYSGHQRELRIFCVQP